MLAGEGRIKVLLVKRLLTGTLHDDAYLKGGNSSTCVPAAPSTCCSLKGCLLGGDDSLRDGVVKH